MNQCYWCGPTASCHHAPACERCQATPAQRAPVMTCYEDSDMNVPPVLCGPCKDEWVEHWESMWREYHAGLL